MSLIEQVSKKYEEISAELKTERSHLKVKMHLFNMDAKDEWEALEKKYEKFKSKASSIAGVTEDSAAEIVEAIKLVGEEIRAGYKRIKKTL